MKFFVVEGKKYILGNTKHSTKSGELKLELVPFNQEEYDKITDEIIDAIESSVDKKALLQEALNNFAYEEIKEMHKTLKRKKAKAKAVRGCYHIDIGKHKLYLVG